MNLVKATYLIIVGGISFGLASTLITQAIKYKNAWAIGILLAIGVLIILVLGVTLALSTQLIQSKIAINNLFANAQENMALLSQVQQGNAKTMTAQYRAMQAENKAMMSLPGNNNDTDDMIVDVLNFDSEAFTEIEGE